MPKTPDERLVLLSTRLVDTNQPNLPAYTTTKYETGLQWQIRNADIFFECIFLKRLMGPMVPTA